MDDGISLTGLTIGGTALTTIGAIVGAYWKARYGRTEIHPQPLDVRTVERPTPPSLCEERHRQLNGQMECIFSAIATTRTTAGKVEAIEKRVESMDGKLDVIVGEWAKGRPHK